MQIKKWLKRSLIVIPLAIGIAAIVVAPKLKKPPQKVETVERATKVRVIKPVFEEVSPKLIGYGSTLPTKSWDAVAEVAGRVSWVSDQLKEGAIIPKGAELIKIDDSDLKLSLSQVNAQINTSKIRADTTKRSLAVEQRNRASLKKEVVRQQALRKKNLVPANILEAAERNLIRADATIQNLKNSLSIIDAERQVLVVQRKQVELELSRVKIISPFDIRIIEINAHEARFANKGQVLFSADATDKAEIEARFPIGLLRPLISSKQAAGFPGALGLDAVVRLRTSSHVIEWKAKVERSAGQIDRQTQTTGVIVSVDDPYGKARPGQRPPLSRNTFVEVELRGKPKGKQVILPTSAVHEGKVYILNSENRLEIKKVKVGFRQGRYAVISAGVKPDQKVVVSDLIPSIENMLLEPVMDKKTRKMLITEITGKSPESKDKKKPKASDTDKKEAKK